MVKKIGYGRILNRFNEIGYDFGYGNPLVTCFFGNIQKCSK